MSEMAPSEAPALIPKREASRQRLLSDILIRLSLLVNEKAKILRDTIFGFAVYLISLRRN